jgi:hypothetical protein
MKNGALFVVWFHILMFFSPLAWAALGDWTGNLNFTVGGKALDEGDWEPVDEQLELGVDVDFRSRSWPISMVIALRGSSAREDDVVVDGIMIESEGSTNELRFGIRKIWEPAASMYPFFGGGLAVIATEFERRALGVTEHDDDMGAGLWLGGGIYWILGSHINLGFELGYSQARISFFGQKGEAGGSHAALLLGYHW